MSNLYMEIEGRRAVIIDYAQRYGIRTFVETGTADGSTTAAMVPYFDKLHTIEIDEGMYLSAIQQFNYLDGKVGCWYGDSAVRLPELVSQLTAPALFWLDGHYCGGPTRGSLDSPVVSELDACFKAPQGSVILIDDARLFGGGPAAGGDNGENYTGYPDLGYVHMLANASGYHYLLQDDIIRLTSREI